MKKRGMYLLGLSLLTLGLTASCTTKNMYTPVEVDPVYSNIRFFVDGNLYATARAKNGETIRDKHVIEDPKKDGYEFKGWRLASGKDFDVKTEIINENIDLYAHFEKIKIEVPVDPTMPDFGETNVLDTKDPNKNYFMVIGWYGKTSTSQLDETNVKHFATNLFRYLYLTGVSKEDIATISIRQYGNEPEATDVATAGGLINADGDVDILIGVGGNIDTKGGVVVKEKKSGMVVNGSSRTTARLSDDPRIKLTYNYITAKGTNMVDETYFVDNSNLYDPIELNVLDKKDENPDYYTIGWYGKSATSALTVDVMTNFANNLVTYLRATGVSDDDIKTISIRQYCNDEEPNDVAAMGELINTDADVDLVLGCGGNIDTSAGVAIKEKIGGVMMNGKSRYIARLTDDTGVKGLFDYLVSTSGHRLFDPNFTLKAEEIYAPVEINVMNKKGETPDSLTFGWYGKTSTSGCDETNMKHFASNLATFLRFNGYNDEFVSKIGIRQYGNEPEATDIATTGGLVNADGDVDILLGVGGNIDTKGGVTCLEKNSEIPMGGKSRTIARLTDDPECVAVYEFLKTDLGKKIYDTNFTLRVEDLVK